MRFGRCLTVMFVVAMSLDDLKFHENQQSRQTYRGTAQGNLVGQGRFEYIERRSIFLRIEQ